MCVDGDNLDSKIWKNFKQTCFSYFWCGFKIKSNDIHEHVMNNQEHVKNT